jgi:hypothetical protein
MSKPKRPKQRGSSHKRAQVERQLEKTVQESKEVLHKLSGVKQ